MNDRILGTCSSCGGPVTVASSWLGTQPQTPSCRACGARPKNHYGPVIETEQPKPGPQLLNERTD